MAKDKTDFYRAWPGVGKAFFCWCILSTVDKRLMIWTSIARPKVAWLFSQHTYGCVKQNEENGTNSQIQCTSMATSTSVSTVGKSNTSFKINVSVHAIASKASFTSLYTCNGGYSLAASWIVTIPCSLFHS